MANWAEKVLSIRDQIQAERQRRKTIVEVLQNLPERGVVEELRADGSRTRIYNQIPGANTESA